MGYFEFKLKDGTTKRVDNHLVDVGKAYFIDFAFNSNQWNTGTQRYFGASLSTNTNAGVDGPSGASVKEADGPWQGVDNADWKLTTPESGVMTSRIALTCIRSGKTALLEGQITDSDVANPLATYYFNEFGIFLGDNMSYPNANPLNSAIAANKENAMIVRAVSYYKDGTGGYHADPLIKEPGAILPFRYVFSFMDG